MSHEAVIEILIALLGLMIAVLTLISGVVAIGIAIVGFLGYQTIRDEAARRSAMEARKVASKVAKATATKIANRVAARIKEVEQAEGLSEGQIERPVGDVQSGIKPSTRSRRKATKDQGLMEGGEQ